MSAVRAGKAGSRATAYGCPCNNTFQEIRQPGQSRRTGPACCHVLGNTVKLQRIALQFGGAFPAADPTIHSGYDD